VHAEAEATATEEEGGNAGVEMAGIAEVVVRGREE